MSTTPRELRRGLMEPVMYHGEKIGELVPAREGRLSAWVRTVGGPLQPAGIHADRDTAIAAVVELFIRTHTYKVMGVPSVTVTG